MKKIITLLILCGISTSVFAVTPVSKKGWELNKNALKYTFMKPNCVLSENIFAMSMESLRSAFSGLNFMDNGNGTVSITLKNSQGTGTSFYFETKELCTKYYPMYKKMYDMQHK